MSWFTRLLDLDSWRDSVIKEIEEAKTFALTEISAMDSAKISERLEPVLMDSAYIIQLPESATQMEADRLREAVEGLGAHCVVVTANTMKVLTFPARLDNRD